MAEANQEGKGEQMVKQVLSKLVSKTASQIEPRSRTRATYLRWLQVKTMTSRWNASFVRVGFQGENPATTRKSDPGNASGSRSVVAGFDLEPVPYVTGGAR